MKGRRNVISDMREQLVNSFSWIYIISLKGIVLRKCMQVGRQRGRVIRMPEVGVVLCVVFMVGF